VWNDRGAGYSAEPGCGRADSEQLGELVDVLGVVGERRSERGFAGGIQGHRAEAAHRDAGARLGFGLALDELVGGKGGRVTEVDRVPDRELASPRRS
jgi:hypothetical protein